MSLNPIKHKTRHIFLHCCLFEAGPWLFVSTTLWWLTAREHSPATCTATRWPLGNGFQQLNSQSREIMFPLQMIFNQVESNWYSSLISLGVHTGVWMRKHVAGLCRSPLSAEFPHNHGTAAGKFITVPDFRKIQTYTKLQITLQNISGNTLSPGNKMALT